MPSGTRVACLLGGRPPFTSLSLRSLRLAHKSTSKLVLLVLVTRVCHAAFREVRSRRGETIGFRGMAAGTRASIPILLRWPPPLGPPRIQLGALKRAGCAAEVASGALSASSSALLRSSSARFASQERSGCVLGSILGPLDPKIYAPVEARA